MRTRALRVGGRRRDRGARSAPGPPSLGAAPSTSSAIEREVRRGRRRGGARADRALRRDRAGRRALRVDPARPPRRSAALDPALREALELAAANIRAVAEAQLATEPQPVELPQGQTVTVREVPVGAAGIYAPGGRAAYPSSVLMCAIPARVAGVERVALASPPGPDGERQPARPRRRRALRGRRDLRDGRRPGDLRARLRHRDDRRRSTSIAGPGNAWVREAKRAVYGHGRHRLARRPLGADGDRRPRHRPRVGGARPLRPGRARRRQPAGRGRGRGARARRGRGGDRARSPPSAPERRRRAAGAGPGPRPRATRSTSPTPSPPSTSSCSRRTPALLADRVTTAGCVFVGRYGATAFGDYVAGSNHVLPTGGAGRFSGPLGPGVFRRRISTVEIPAEAAAKLAPHVDALARAEGFPVHGESAMIRSES